MNLGLACREAGDLEAAREALHRASVLEPEGARVHHELGAVLLALDRPRDALKALDYALALDDEARSTRALRGRALIRLGRLEEAEEAIARASSPGPAPQDGPITAARTRADSSGSARATPSTPARSGTPGWAGAVFAARARPDTPALPRPAPPPEAAPAREPELSADLADFPLPELLEFLGTTRRSGVLEVPGGYVELVQGRLRGVRAEDGREVADSFDRCVEVVTALIAGGAGRAVFRARAPSPGDAEEGLDPRGVLLEAFRRIDEGRA